MILGNIIASLGIIIGFIGLIMIPLYNFQELPFSADMGYAKGGGWKLLAQSITFRHPCGPLHTLCLEENLITSEKPEKGRNVISITA